MAHDIAAKGNALVDTQFMVELDFLHEIGMKPDEMVIQSRDCLLYTSPSPRDQSGSRMPSSA